MTISIPPEYYNIVANIESGGNPNAASSTSSASGLYGFINNTRNALSGRTDYEKMVNLTHSNASILTSHGIDISNQNLYTAHFLGANDAINVLTADNSSPLSDLVSKAAITANPFLKGMNVGQFKDFTAAKTGGDTSGASGGPSNTDLAVTAAKEGSQFATDLASGNYVAALSDGVQDVLGVFGIGNRKPGGNSDTGSSKSSGSIFSWGDFFSAHTATRFAFVIIGIILVGVAVVYLAANSDTGKTVINNVKEVGKTVATTAVVAAA